MKKIILILILSISLQNCKSDVEKVQENAQSFTKSLLSQKHLSKSFIQTFGIQRQSQLSNLIVEKPVPCIYLQKEDLKDFLTFKNSVKNFKPDTYLVNYSLDGRPVSQWTFISTSVSPIAGTPYDCGTILNPLRLLIVDRTTGKSIPLGLPDFILKVENFQYEVFMDKGELYGREISSSNTNLDALPTIYKEIKSEVN